MAQTVKAQPIFILGVRLAGPSGERWAGISAGGSEDDALRSALADAPAGISWLLLDWAVL